jgi:hypothetical protein
LKSYQTKAIKAEAEIDRLKNVENYLKDQFKILENVIIEKTNEMEKLEKENELLKLSSEEKMVAIQLQLNQSKIREENKSQEMITLKHEIEKLAIKVQQLSKGKEEKEILLATNKEMIMALQTRLMELEPEVSVLREKVKDHERRYASLQMLKTEQDNIVAATQRELKHILQEKEMLQQRFKELDEARMKAEGQAMKLANVNDEINQLKEEFEEKSATIIRLRSEAQTNERNHAMRTAMLATCEAQIETLQQEFMKKDEIAKEALQRVTDLQIALATLEHRLEERTLEHQQEMTTIQQESEQTKIIQQTLLKAKEQEYQELSETLKKDFSKKSAMARQLLSEREEEVRILSAKVQELIEEIASGAPTERKIFELAQVQSRRDAFNGAHR